jgi:manganese/zinc/iron transport system permease protein
MLIVPGATAYLLTDRLSVMLLISAIVGVLSAVLGYGLATVLDASIAGAMSTVAGVIFALTFILSPTHGLLARWLAHRSLGGSAQN